MNYCDVSELSYYILQAYLDAVEEQTPGAMAKHIAKVSAEITESILQGGYELKPDAQSATLTRICAVIAGWRSVAGVTSLMTSDGGADNEWLPLQQLKRDAEKDLGKIREGKLDPFPMATASEPEAVDSGISVKSEKPMFPSAIWGGF